jgi:methionyl aminopeptidase
VGEKAMTIKNTEQLLHMQKVSEAAAITLKEMRRYAAPGMTTKELDEFGAAVLNKFGARSAPNSAYGFPGYTCISLNHEIAHGIPSSEKFMREGDLMNSLSRQSLYPQ